MLRLIFVRPSKPEMGHGFEDAGMPFFGLTLVYHLKSDLVTNVLSRLGIWTSRHGLPVIWKVKGSVCFRRENNRHPVMELYPGKPPRSCDLRMETSFCLPPPPNSIAFPLSPCSFGYSDRCHVGQLQFHCTVARPFQAALKIRFPSDKQVYFFRAIMVLITSPAFSA
jgi:hypothetical protein